MTLIDPITSLAFSMRANPGVYAVLLGSGVSRAANIPTGWEIVEDLIRRLADSKGANAGENPEKWYYESEKKAPNYSELLGTLFKRPAERQQFLQNFFEPSSDESEGESKTPTEAHHIVASLMKKGLIRVVVTTNFDKLLEQALQSGSIEPVVISTPSQAKGMMPLDHQKHCIIKVHGDYLDPRILNTEEELAKYDPRMLRLIKRIFDDYGVIVCGWSASYDLALCDAIMDTPNRRFSWYWAQKGRITQEAQKVIDDRCADVIEIESADNFFSEISGKISGLKEYARSHPLTVSAAIGAAKKYLGEPPQTIRLHDLYKDVLDETIARWKEISSSNRGEVSAETVDRRLQAYEASSEAIVNITALIGRWSDASHDDLLADGLSRATGDGLIVEGDHDAIWRRLSAYPAKMILFSAGMASIVKDCPFLFYKLMVAPIFEHSRANLTALDKLRPPSLDDGRPHTPLINGRAHRFYEVHRLLESLRDVFRPFVVNEGDYQLLFDTFTFYLAIAASAAESDYCGYIPTGLWAGQRYGRIEQILSGLEGLPVRYGGRDFAQKFLELINHEKSLDDLVPMVKEAGHYEMNRRA